MTLLLFAVTGAWADTTLLSIDFSDETTWTKNSTIFSSMSTSNAINGIYGAGYTTAYITSDGVLDWYNYNSGSPKNNGNMDTNRFMCVKIANVNKSVNVAITTAINKSMRYKFTEGTTISNGSSYSTSSNASSGQLTLSYTMTGSGTDLVFYFGQSGSSNNALIKTITITTPEASGKEDPSLTATPVSATLSVGGTQQITASATSTGAITYTSSNTNVATVNASGLVTAVGIGNATITTSVAETDDYDGDSKLTSITVKSAAVTANKYATLNGSLVNSPEGFVAVNETTATTEYNTKYKGSYNGTSFTSGLKMQNGTSVDFTTSSVCDLVVVQSIASNPNNLIKIDGTTFATNYDDVSYYDDAANNVRVYVVKNLAAGDHSITRTSELGLLYVGVTEEDTQVAAPVISPADGSSFTSASQSVTISCTTEDATIYYTLDGTTPTASSTEYTGAFTITSTTTIKAIAVKDEMDDSNVVTATITKKVSAIANSWDFTNWSAATKTGVIADTEAWNSEEKSDASGLHFGDNGRSNISELSKNTIKYGSTNIAETEGLKFTAGAYGMGLMFNLPSATVNSIEYTYHGSQYIWLYGKNSKIVISSVEAGATIAIGVESHNGGNARGVTLNNSTQTKGEATSTTYQDCEWTVNTTGEITITPTSGLHIYYIRISSDVETVPVTTNCEGGLATFASTKALDLSKLPEGVKAYKVATAAGSSARLEEVTVAVAAGTGLIFKGTKDATYNIPVAESASTLSGNLLVGVTDAAGYTTTSDTDAYALSKSDGMLHPVAANVTIPTGKAYLPASYFASNARSISLVFDDETTGIGATLMNSERVNNEVYNLNGQRVAQPSKGLYIVNGRKVVIK